VQREEAVMRYRQVIDSGRRIDRLVEARALHVERLLTFFLLMLLLWLLTFVVDVPSLLSVVGAFALIVLLYPLWRLMQHLV
jgi:hypothetical protein